MLHGDHHMWSAFYDQRDDWVDYEKVVKFFEMVGPSTHREKHLLYRKKQNRRTLERLLIPKMKNILGET